MKRKNHQFIVALCFAMLSIGFGSPPAPGQDDAPAEHTVILRDILFSPSEIKIALGDRIDFINQDPFDHDVYLVRAANRNIALIQPITLKSGQSTTITIEEEGLFTLYCTIHGGMRGKMTTPDSLELSDEEKEAFAKITVLPPIVRTGEEYFWNRAQCFRCHQIDDRGDGLRGPNLQDIGFRAKVTAQKLGLGSATAYILQSIMEPSAHIVEGFSDDMPKVYQQPINLNEEELKAIVAYLQSQGGEVDTWAIDINKQILETELPESPFPHGDPGRGALVFQAMGCNSCHTVADRKAISIGPDLTAIGAFRNWTWLAKSLIDPNAEIGANWRGATAYLKPGFSLVSDELNEGEEMFFDDEEDEELDEDVGSGSNQGSVTPGKELADAQAEMEKLRRHILELQKKQAGISNDDVGLAIEDFLGSVEAFLPVEPEDLDRNEPSDEGTEAGGESGTEEVGTFGEAITGVLRKNTSEEVQLLVGPDRIETIPGDQIAGVKMAKLSRMPGDYSQLLTFKQVGDLVRYLESLVGPTETGGNDIALRPE